MCWIEELPMLKQIFEHRVHYKKKEDTTWIL